MHPVYLLALATLVAVLAFLGYTYISHKRNRDTGGGNTSGIGGPNDPLAGANTEIRDPEVLRRSLDAAHDTPPRVRAMHAAAEEKAAHQP